MPDHFNAPEETVERKSIDDKKPTATPELTSMHMVTSSLASPDKKWLAQSMAAFPVDGQGPRNYHTQLKVGELTGTLTWYAVDKWADWGLGYTIPEPFRWSSDGRYLYFTNKPVPDGCGVFVNGSDLHKIDLTNGDVMEVAPPLSLWLSLSPDEHTLAYVGDGLVLRELATGRERTIKLNMEQGDKLGHVLWAADGSALMLTLAIRPCQGQLSESVWADSTSVIRVDLEARQTSTLIDKDVRRFITVDWSASNTVMLKDVDGNFWKMSAVTGQTTKSDTPLTPLTPG